MVLFPLLPPIWCVFTFTIVSDSDLRNTIEMTRAKVQSMPRGEVEGVAKLRYEYSGDVQDGLSIL